MNVDIVKEIQAKTNNLKKSLGLDNDAVSEVKGLLEYQTLEDSYILSNLGVNSMNTKLEENKGKLLIIEKFENIAKFTVVHISTIEDLCMKYRLRFLPSGRYTGAIPPDITTEIKQLEKNKANNDPKGNFKKFDESHLKKEFFIMAPPKMFKLEERKKVERVSYFKQFITALREEPILFYREDSEHYVMVKKWGNDFTIFRRLLGTAMKSVKNLYLTVLTILLVPDLLFSTFGTNSSIGSSHILTAVSAFFMFGIFAAIISGVIVAFSSNDQDFTDNNWNSSTK
jgi:hypothetical protein